MKPVRGKKLITQSLISHYGELAKVSLDEQDDYEDLLENIKV